MVAMISRGLLGGPNINSPRTNKATLTSTTATLCDSGSEVVLYLLPRRDAAAFPAIPPSVDLLTLPPILAARLPRLAPDTTPPFRPGARS